MRSVRHSARTLQALRSTLLSVGFALPFLLLCAGSGSAVAQDKLFPTDLPGPEWVQFPAAGFSQPACGVIYRLTDRVSCGVPLGGIDVGCIDLETSGLLGYCTIFNSHVPRRGPLNLPLLGLGVGGKTWVLCDPTKAKAYEATGGPKPVEPYPRELSLEGVETVRQIHYWGHYPVADLEFETDAPVGVGLRAWAPFLPGSVEAPKSGVTWIADSLIPGIVFQVHLRNMTDSEQSGTVALSFPGPTAGEAGAEVFRRERVEKDFDGVVVEAPQASYALGVIGKEKLRLGGELGADGAAWARIGGSLPKASEDQPGSSVAVDFRLGPGEKKVVRFVLAWYSPKWKGGGHPTSPEGNTFTHMYARYYPSAQDAARVLARRHRSLLKRILAWQEVIYADQRVAGVPTEHELPIWLRDCLVNILHLFTEDGLWAQAGPPLPDWVRPEDGLFGMNESPRGCPQIECIPCSFYGSLPLVYFFPELALSTLRGYKGYQDAEGSPPWIFGGVTGQTPPIDFACPTRGYQVTLNVPCYVDMVDRYWLCSGDEEFLREFYPSVKKATLFMVDLNRGPEGIISMPDRKVSMGPMEWETEWFEWYEWHGMATHVGGIHLATLRMVDRMAMAMGDREFAKRCREWIQAGQEALESKMWAGSYYLNYWDPASGKKSDEVFAYQLDGEWMAKFHGLEGVFRPDRVKTTLETIKRLNVPPTRYGAINYVRPDGSVLSAGAPPMRGPYAPYDFFSPEVFMLAMTYLLADEENFDLNLNRWDESADEFGFELARRCMQNIVIEQGLTWDMPNIIRGDTGERTFGNDYYQNLMLWGIPAVASGWTGYLTAGVVFEGLARRVSGAAAPGPWAW